MSELAWMRVALHSGRDLEEARLLIENSAIGPAAGFLEGLVEKAQYYGVEVIYLARTADGGIQWSITPPDEEDLSEMRAEVSQGLERAEVEMFELDSERNRTMLAEWARSLLPGCDLEALQRQVTVGDLVVLRPSATTFTVYRDSKAVDQDTLNFRIQIAHLAGGDVKKAEAIAKWVYNNG